MSLITIDPDETREVTLADDTVEPKTLFTVGTIDARLQRHIEDDTAETTLKTGRPQVQIKAAQRWLQYVQYGIRGWKNLRGKHGEIPFNPEQHLTKTYVPDVGERTGLTDTALNLLKPFITQLGIEVYNANTVTPEQSKN